MHSEAEIALYCESTRANAFLQRDISQPVPDGLIILYGRRHQRRPATMKSPPTARSTVSPSGTTGTPPGGSACCAPVIGWASAGDGGLAVGAACAPPHNLRASGPIRLTFEPNPSTLHSRSTHAKTSRMTNCAGTFLHAPGHHSPWPQDALAS